MGMRIRNCQTNYCQQEFAPAPNPKRWTILDKVEYSNSYVLRVKYHDCTNFEGVKIMVYRGKFINKNSLDPHFYDGDSPIARFKPDEFGWKFAIDFAKNL